MNYPAAGCEGSSKWEQLAGLIEALFGIRLDSPEYIKERVEIVMSYRTRGNIRLEISSSGRGQQQTLLLLAHMTANPGAVLLLDEPDAHLEILRQRQIYRILTETAARTGSQIIAASHSEVILNEAADRDVVIAFVGQPHRIDDRGSQVIKALKEIGFEHYYLAEEVGWVLYLEGSTDLAILRAFAERLEHLSEGMRFGPEIMARVVEAYRKLRNTLRILVANLYDFDPAADMVPPLLMDEVDRFAMVRYGELASKIMTAYERYDFPAIFQALNAFVAVDLSAFYVDVTKDRVYTLAARSRGRR